MTFTVRQAGEADLGGILDIYNDAVVNTTAIWNDVTVDLGNRRAWWRGRTEAGLPVLAAVEGNDVLGYASYGPFRAFDGYRQTVEHSIYVAENARRRGVASALLAALEEHARAHGMHVLLGGITADNTPSLALHAKHGFIETARMPEVGQKFGRYLDLVFMQKLI